MPTHDWSLGHELIIAIYQGIAADSVSQSSAVSTQASKFQAAVEGSTALETLACRIHEIAGSSSSEKENKALPVCLQVLHPVKNTALPMSEIEH